MFIVFVGRMKTSRCSYKKSITGAKKVERVQTVVTQETELTQREEYRLLFINRGVIEIHFLFEPRSALHHNGYILRTSACLRKDNGDLRNVTGDDNDFNKPHPFRLEGYHQQLSR